MKPVALLFFAFTTPLSIFLVILLYGTITPESFKAELRSSEVYKKAHAQFTTTQAAANDDQDYASLNALLAETITPTYLQNKTETLIDDTYLWLTKDGAPPTLSLIEVKDAMLANDPDFEQTLKSMEKDPEFIKMKEEYEKEMQNSEQPLSPQDAERASALDFSENMFTVPVGEQAPWLKDVYSKLHIILPVLLVLQLGCILLLVFRNVAWTSRFRWVGITLIAAAIVGMSNVFLNTLILERIMADVSFSEGNLASAFTPILFHTADYFAQTYATYQTATSTWMVIIGIVFLVGAFLTKPKPKLFLQQKPKGQK